MKYLAPIGGFTDHRFGILVSPGSYGIPEGVHNGMAWAADNQAFTKGFNPDTYFPWLETMISYRSTCLFVVCPDVVGDAQATLELFQQWQPQFSGWPVAFVAQDGQEDLPFPHTELWSTLFIGGSTEWKMSTSAVECIQRAQQLEKRIHIGRVNYGQRYTYFASLPGSESWTCDGTRTRYEHDKAINAWRKYMARPKQYNLFVFGGDHSGESGGG